MRTRSYPPSAARCSRWPRCAGRADRAVGLPASAGASRAAVLPKPGQGGKLVFAGYLPSLWDPALSTAGTDVSALSLVYSGLTKLDVHGNPVPDIASSWKWSKNGLSHHVHAAAAPRLLGRRAARREGRQDEHPARPRRPEVADRAAARVDQARCTRRTRRPSRCVLNQLDWDLPRVLAGKTGELVSPKAIATNPAGLATQPVGAGPVQAHEPRLRLVGHARAQPDLLGREGRAALRARPAVHHRTRRPSSRRSRRAASTSPGSPPTRRSRR